MLIFSVEEMHALADRLAAILRPGDCITLQGDLGAGKTTFVQRLVQALSPQPVGVTSPTFTLLQTYDVMLEDQTLCTLWHYDLYRLEDEDETQELALDDALDGGVAVIEWPELVMHLLPESRIGIVIEFGETSTSRNVTFSGGGDRLQRLKEAHLC